MPRGRMAGRGALPRLGAESVSEGLKGRQGREKGRGGLRDRPRGLGERVGPLGRWEGLGMGMTVGFNSHAHVTESDRGCFTVEFRTGMV